MTSYKVINIDKLPIYRIDGLGDAHSISGYKLRGQFIPDLSDRLLAAGSKQYRVFNSGLSAVDSAYLELVGPPPPPPLQIVDRVQIVTAPAILQVGNQVQLAAVVTASNGAILTGHPLSWSSNTAGVATISASGLVSALAPGQTTITVTCEGKTSMLDLTIRAAIPPPLPGGTDTLYVWGGSPIGVYKNTYGQPEDEIGKLVADPIFAHPIIVGPTGDNSLYRWRQIVGGDMPANLIGGWLIEKQNAFSFLAQKPIGEK